MPQLSNSVLNTFKMYANYSCNFSKCTEINILKFNKIHDQETNL